MDIRKRRRSRFLPVIFAIAVVVGQASAESPPAGIPASESPRIEALEQTVRQLQAEVDALRLHRPLETAYAAPACDRCTTPGACPSHYLTYDGGWVIRPRNPSRSPFEFQLNVHNQFRYTGFANTNDVFVDSAGNARSIAPRNDFDINRGRFVFSGYAFDPNIRFYTNVDYNTVATNPMLLLLSWISYRFGDALTVYMGLGKVPGTWEWQVSSRFTLGAERTLATTFFRPSITGGLWAEGKLGESLHYQALIGDGFNTFTLRASELDTNLVYSALSWCEPLGEFGTGFSDLECHDDLSVRLGHGFTTDRNDADPGGQPGPEQTVIRLSDGTRLVQPGALAPGVTVNQFDIHLYAVHLGLKRRGFSFAGEYFFRWLSSLQGTGPLPVRELFDHGFFVQGGFFMVPKRLEVYAIGSQVTGDFGRGTEVGGGLNWYAGGQRGNRLTLEVTDIRDSPAEQDRTGYVAGASGTLFRVQWWHFF